MYFQVIYFKQPIVELTQEWFRELSFSRLECGVHDRLHIYPTVRDLLLPLVYTPSRKNQRLISYTIVSDLKVTGNVG